MYIEMSKNKKLKQKKKKKKKKEEETSSSTPPRLSFIFHSAIRTNSSTI